MSEMKNTMKALQKLNECAIAAETFTSKLTDFEVISNDFNQKVVSISNVSDKWNVNETIENLEEATNKIEQVFHFFDERLPEFETTITDTSENLSVKREEIIVLVDSIKKIKDELNSIDDLAEDIRGIKSSLAEITNKNFIEEVEEVRSTVEDMNKSVNDFAIQINQSHEDLSANMTLLNGSIEGSIAEIGIINGNIENTRSDFTSTINDLKKSFEKNTSKQYVKAFEDTIDEFSGNNEKIFSSLMTLFSEHKNKQDNLDEKINGMLENRDAFMKDAIDKIIHSHEESISRIEDIINSNPIQSASVLEPGPHTIDEIVKAYNNRLPVTIKKDSWSKGFCFVLTNYVEGKIKGYFEVNGEVEKKDKPRAMPSRTAKYLVVE